MRIISPTKITDSMLLFSSIPEESIYSVYNPALMYSAEDRVYVEQYHLVFEAIQAVPVSTPPKDPLGGVVDEYWLPIRATERWLAFDQKVGGVKIESNQNIVYKIKPGVFSGVAMLGVEGTEIELKLEETSLSFEEIRTISLINTSSGDGEVVDWYSYFFANFSLVEEFASFDWPSFEHAELTITIKGAAPKLAEIVIGRTQDLGITQYEPQFSIVDYSRKDRDIFGNFIIVPRGFSKKVDVHVVVPTSQINYVSKLLSEIRTTPVIWVPAEAADYQSTLLVYGYYKDFSMIIPHPIWAEMNLQIEGLT